MLNLFVVLRYPTSTMPRTKASQRSAAAKKKTADRHGGVADVVVALTDGIMPPHNQKALTEIPPPQKSN
ncbi:hypothetical protein SRHO_G00080600 [Serrasalmus rhombeus]